MGEVAGDISRRSRAGEKKWKASSWGKESEGVWAAVGPAWPWSWAANEL